MTKIQHKRSSVLNSGSAQAPSSAQLDYGELAINYNTSDPQLFIKDSSGSVISILNSYAALSGASFSGDVNFEGEAVIKGDSTNSGALTLNSETNAKYIKIQAPANSGLTNYTLTLPSNAGNNSSVLTTDGSGNLSWALSSMSTADKNKLDGIAAGAEVNVNADWNASSGDAQILNKPTIPTNNNQLTNGAGYITSFDITTQTDSKYLRSDANDTASGQINLTFGDQSLISQHNGTGNSWRGRILVKNSSIDKSVFLGTYANSAGVFAHNHALSAWADLYVNTVDGTSGGTVRMPSSVLVNGSQVWHAGNDGSGTGLDADTLDGIQQSGFYRFHETTAISNYNSLSAGAWSTTSTTATNIPYANYNATWHISDSTNDRQYQLYLGDSPAGGFRYRTKQGSSTGWHSWQKIWTDTNDGSGSGLDADTVDGVHASTFVRTDARAISLNNGATGSTGNEITVGNSTPQYTLRDTNQRPIIQATGAYPVLSLNHTTTTNSNHGPTIQFSHNGYDSNEQIVVGTTGQGRWLDVGFSGGGYGTNTNFNPHNGISGYSGLTSVRIFSNGVLLGATGTYPNHVTSTSYALDVRGTAYASSDMRAPIFYDANNTAYYGDFAGTGNSLNIAGSLRAATYHRPAIKCVASGTASTGGAIAIQQETSEGWTAIFADYEPYTGWGLWHDNPNNYFCITAESSTNSIRSFSVPSVSSGNRTAHEKIRFEQSSGTLRVGGVIFAGDSGAENDRPLRVSKASGHNSCCAIFENAYGDNSWGIVGEFRVANSTSGNDRPSILFSSAYNSNTWSVGFGYNDSNFRIKIDHGYRNGGWGSDRMNMDRSGNVTFSGNVTAYSDIRLKDKVVPLKNCLAKLKRLSGVSFIWKDKSEFIGNVGKTDFGIIAQEVEKVFPEVVHASSNTTDDGDNYKTVAYEKLIPVLIESIKELSVRLTAIEDNL